MTLKLVQPDIRYIESYMKALHALKAEGLWWYQDVDLDYRENHFEEHIQELLNGPFTRTDKLVPSTTYWGILNGEFAGDISIRHELNDDLKIVGGHIGYDTAPAYRRRGVASTMLKLSLPIAKELGLEDVLLTCDDTNVASIKVIEKCGGKLTDKKIIAEGKPLKRYYWISV